MLKTVTVGKYVVSQVGPLESVRMRTFLKRVEERQDPIEREALTEWATLAACVTPYISEDEYLQTPIEELQELTLALEKVNSLDSSAPVSKKKRS